MSEFISKDCKLYVGEHDFSASANMLSMTANVETQDATAFGDTTRIKAPGLMNMTANFSGFFEAGVDKIDPVMFDALGVADTVFSMCPTTGADGETAYTIKGVSGNYKPIGGTVGEMLKFDASFEGSGARLVQATVLKSGTVTASGDGTGYQLGSVATGQEVFGAIHVTSLSGTNTPTVTVIIESDTDAGFANATLRLSFTTATSKTAEFLAPLEGEITDSYWRASYTVAGTSPSMDIVVLCGII